MKKALFLCVLAALLAPSDAVFAGADDIMRPRGGVTSRTKKKTKAVTTKPAPVAASAEPASAVPAKKAGAPKTVVTVTNVVTRTRTVKKEIPVTVTNVVTEMVKKEVPVTVTNVVTETVTKEVPVTVTNVVVQADVVTLTNTVFKTDYLTKTNIVTVQDVVTVTNVVTETHLDLAERRALERKLAEAEEARLAALAAVEEAHRAAEAKLEAERAAREEAERQLDEVAQRALDERLAREKAESEKRAAEDRAAADREAALVWKRQLTPEATAPGGEVAPETVKKQELTGRPAVITSDRTDYDRKEGVILFDRNVYVDDEQYKMHADRLFVFLDGTNDLKRLVAIGNVSITNDAKNAVCSRATYHKTTGKIVMYGSDKAQARLTDAAKKGAESQVVGDKITFWLNSEQVQVERSSVSMPGGAAKGKDAKGFLKGGL